MRYLVVGLIDATNSKVVEASSPDEALELAANDLGCPSVCHQCSSEVEIGDVYGFNVIEDEGSGYEVVTHVTVAEEELQRQLDSTRKRLDTAEKLLRRSLAALAFKLKTDAHRQPDVVAKEGQLRLKTNVEKFLAKGAKR